MQQQQKTRVSDVCVWIYLLSKPNMNEQMFTFEF